LLLAVQLVLMGKLLRQPRERAPWYNATGTSFYVLGMMATAIALRGAL
jgi:chlorophyll synthase